MTTSQTTQTGEVTYDEYRQWAEQQLIDPYSLKAWQRTSTLHRIMISRAVLSWQNRCQ